MRMSVGANWLDQSNVANLKVAPVETTGWSHDHSNSDVLRGGVRPPLARWCAIPGHWYDPRTVGLGLKRPLHCCRCWLAKAIPVGTPRHYRGLIPDRRASWSGLVEWSYASDISICLSPQASHQRANHLVSPEAGSQTSIHPVKRIEPHSDNRGGRTYHMAFGL